MLLVDTNIIVPLYVRTAFSDAAKELRERDEVWRTEPFALVELGNILATYERARYLTKAAARESLAHAESVLEPHLPASRARGGIGDGHALPGDRL